MNDSLHLFFEVPGDDFTRAGEASGSVKRTMKQLGIGPEAVRRVSIAMYEGEINMVIHAGGGTVDVYIDINSRCVDIVLKDKGPGIPDIDLAMKEGYSTAPDSVRDLGFGAGMGLPNMKKYTNNMSVESTLGVGTTVSMSVLF